MTENGTKEETERANSTSIIEFMWGKNTESEKSKRKIEEKGGETEEIFKRSNKIDRTSPGVKKMEERKKNRGDRREGGRKSISNNIKRNKGRYDRYEERDKGNER